MSWSWTGETLTKDGQRLTRPHGSGMRFPCASDGCDSYKCMSYLEAKDNWEYLAMRKMVCICVHDVKAEAYMTPIFVPTNLVAVRSFTEAVNQEGHEFASHSEDYSLWRIGTYDVETAKLEAEIPLCLAKGFDLKERE